MLLMQILSVQIQNYVTMSHKYSLCRLKIM